MRAATSGGRPFPPPSCVSNSAVPRVWSALRLGGVANAVKNGRDILTDLRTLGKERICQIHCTNEDGVWLENDPKIDLPKIKQTLDEMGWRGWLVIERSRDAKDPRNVKKNFGANTAYLKSVFQAK